LLYIAEGLPKK